MSTYPSVTVAQQFLIVIWLIVQFSLLHDNQLVNISFFLRVDSIDNKMKNN